MITKIHQSKNLAGTMRYVYQDYKGAEVVDTSCMRDDLEGAQAEISQALDQRPEISKPVFHAILSVPAGDELTNDQWQEIALEYTERMGFENAPYVAVRHMDTDHHHIHIVASRIDDRGQLISDSHNYYRSQAIARDLEIKHDLTRVPSSWEVPERARTQNEYHVMERTGQESTRDRMRDAITRELERHGNAPDLAAALEKHDITLVPKVTQDESKVVGVYFEHEGTRIPGSKVSRDFSWPKLSEKLGYEHERDFKKMTRTPEQDAPRQETAPKQSVQTPTREVTKTREIIRSTPVRSTPSREPTRPTPDRQPTRETPRRAPRVIERSSPTPSTPSPPRVLQEPSRSSNPSASMTREQARDGMAKVLERANYEEGWKGWAESVRAQGVEPVPKGTQADPTKVRGMYFEGGGHTIPGNQVDRAYSIKGLEGRLGAYEPERDASAFRSVEVPGRGREPMPSVEPSPKPHIEPPAPDESLNRESSPAPTPEPVHQDTVRPLVERLRGAGVEIEVEPERFAGQWRGAYQDAQGGTWGAISKDNTVALVKLDQGERVIEAERGGRGEIVPKELLKSHEALSPQDPVEWRREGENKALLKVEPAPEPERESPAPQEFERMPVMGPSPDSTSQEMPEERQDNEPPEPDQGVELMTAQEWVKAQREAGERARVLEVSQTVRGQLQSEKLELRDGSYHVVHSVGGSSVLVKAREELEVMRRDDQTPKVSVRMRRDESLAVSEITRDRGRER